MVVLHTCYSLDLILNSLARITESLSGYMANLLFSDLKVTAGRCWVIFIGFCCRGCALHLISEEET